MPIGRNGKTISVNPRNAANYVKNVGRSFGYAAIESLGNTSPTLKALFSDNKDTVQSLYQEIKDFASSPLEKIRSNEKIMSYSNDIKTGFANLKDDIRTGNFYNMERQNASMMSMMGLDDDIFGDIDFDSDLADLDSSIASKESADIANAEIDAMDDIGSRVSSSVSMATAKSAEYIVKANGENTRAVLHQTSRIFDAMSTGLLGINKTLGSIAQLAQPLTAHMQNSSVFYTETTKNQEKMIELLNTIAENTKRPDPKKKSGKEYSGLDAFLGGDYAFNLSNMGSMMKKNAKEAFENSTLGMLTSMGDMFGEGSLIKMVASNPIGMAMPFLLEGIMSKKLKNSMKKLSDTMAGFNIKLIRDLNSLSKSPNSILSFIGQLFNFDDKNKSQRDTGEYEKGAISFDGVTKHAIVRVIPELLGMILAQLGGPNARYDYKAGKFITKSEIRRQRKQEFNKEVDTLSFEHKMEVDSMDINEVEANRIKASLQKYVSNALREGHYIDPNSKSDDWKKYGFKNEQQMKDVQKLIKHYEKTGQYAQIEILNQQIREARNARAAAVLEDPYLSNEDYMLDNGFAMVSGGTYPINTNGNRGHRTSSSGGNKSGSGKNSEEPDPDQLTVSDIASKLTEKGYTKDTKRYRNFLDRFNKATTREERQKIIDDLNKLQKKSAPKSKFGRFLSGDLEESDTGLAKLLSAPMGFLADQMNKASEALYTIMYGPKDKKQGENAKDYGIIGGIMDQMKDIFTKFKTFLKEDIMDPIKKYFEERGGLVKMISDFFGIEDPEGLKSFVKGKAKTVFGNVASNFRSVGGWLWRNSPVVEAGRKYKERQEQRRFQREVANPVYDQEELMEDIGGMFGHGSGLRRFRGGATAEEVYENGKQKLGDFFSRNGFGGEVGHTISEGLKTFFSRIMPDENKAKDEFDTVKEVTKTSLKEFGADPSGAITGALLGGGVSLLTGGLISPMLAASIGAAAGLTIKSNAVQDMLFGKMEDVVDENGNVIGQDRNGGVFSKELSDFMRKELPGMAAWGATGGILSMMPGIPGGPVAGIVIGSALGFANKNSAMQEFLWGNEKENGLLGSQEDRKNKADWIKRMAPKAVAGAVLGAFIPGPFGIMGNMMTGTAIGFASETELFKRYMFGEEKVDENGNKYREGGITGWIKKDIISPVANAIAPITVELKNKGKDIIRWTVRSIAGVFEKATAIPLFNGIKEYFLKPLAGKFIPTLFKGIGGIVTLPFKAVGAIGTGLRRKQIRTGRANDMTAKDRLQYRRDNRMEADEFTDFDSIIAGMDIEGEGGLQEAISRFETARKSKNPEEIDAAITEFSTKFGLQNKNVNIKNIDKWLDTVKGEVKNRKTNPEAIKIDLDKMRNALMESHYKKTENMLGLLVNKMFKRKIYDVETPSDVTEEAAASTEENAPTSIKDTRRSFGTTVKSIFNPFTGMDMPSVQEAIAYYEDTLDGNTKKYRGAHRRDLASRVRKVEVDGQFRDDVIQVTDKNGYTVTVQKVNGAWMPYKIGTQLLNSMGLGNVVKSVTSVAKGIGTGIRLVGKALTGNPFFGIDGETVTKIIEIYWKMIDTPEEVTEEEKDYFRKHGAVLDGKYPGEHVLRITDNAGHIGTGRWAHGGWHVLDIGWKAVQGVMKVGRAVANVGRKIGSTISRGIDAIRHINPFCDFEASEVGPIVDSLNAMEEGGSDETGKIRRVKGLMHYYTVTSTNGAVVTVTPKFGKWTYVSNKELQAAKARAVVGGIGGVIKNAALRAINAIGNRNNVSSSSSDLATAGAGSRLKKFIGAGSQFSLFGALKTKIARDGQEVIDTQDKESRATLRIRDNFINKFNDIADYVRKIAGSMPEEGEETEEGKKKGLFDSLKDMVTGENGLLGGIGTLLSGTAVGKWAGTFLTKMPSLKAILGGAGMVALAAGAGKIFVDALKGKFDELANKIGLADRSKEQTYNQGIDSGTDYTTGSGVNENGEVEAVATDENGNPVTDEDGNYLSTNGNILTNVKYNTGQGTFSQRLLGNTARSLVTGTGVGASILKLGAKGLNKMTGGLAGKLGKKLANTGISKLATAVGKKVVASGGLGATMKRLAAKASVNGIKTTAKGLKTAAANVFERSAGAVLADQLLDPSSGQVYKIFNGLKKLPILKNFASGLDNMAAALSKTIAEKVADKGAEEIGKAVLGAAAFAAKLVLMAWDFEEGYNHAQRTLGIKNPDTPQKILSGIIRVVKNLLPIVGSLIPDKVVVDLFIKIIAPFFGIDVAEFTADQAAAQKELDEYNQTNGTELSWDEYVQTVGQHADENGNTWGEKTWGESIVSGAKTAWNNLKHAASYSAGTKPTYYSGAYTGGASFVSQLDPRVASRRFGSSTIGANGCAPSVASMITGYDLGTTAGMATKGGYANSAGTSADYFGRVLGSAGIPAEYVYTGAGSAQDYLAGKIASGSPTVLLGQDPYNTSKAYSPFGPGNHYVLATGMTRGGGVVVQDPESSRPNMVYDSSILNSVKLGIPTGGRSGLRRARRLRGGAAMAADTGIAGNNIKGTGNATDNQKQIWTYLKKKGLSEEGAAALMGCWECESGNRPDRIEGDFLASFPGFDVVASNQSAMDKYVVNTLFPATEKNVKINRSAYMVGDHYYPGFGLAQWTGSRAKALHDFCASHGYNWKMLLSQLEFAWNELETTYSKVKEELKKKGDIAELTDFAARKYEGCKKSDWILERQQKAAAIYNALTGRTYSLPSSTGTAMSSSDIADANSALANANSGGIMSGITSLGGMFGKLFSAVFGDLGKLFGLSSGESEEGGEDTTGEEGIYSSNSTSDQVLAGIPFDESSRRGKAQKALVEKMASVTGKLAYSMNGPRDPDKGSADCSSTVNWAYNKVLGQTLGNSTLSMYQNNSNLSTIDMASGLINGYNTNTSGPNLSNLQPGDIMLFSRNWNGTQGRPYQIGHVSMYAGEGKALSHGSNNGPRLVDVSSDGTYVMSRRYTPFMSADYDTVSASRQKELEQAARSGAYVGTGSGLVGNYNIARDAYNTINRRHHSSNSVFGAGSKIVNLSGYTDTRKAKYVSNLIANMRASGTGTDNEVLIALIKAVITLLSNVSNNSDKINAALATLSSLVESQSVAGNGSNMNINEARKGIGVSDTDSTLAELQTLLNSLASGA